MLSTGTSPGSGRRAHSAGSRPIGRTWRHWVHRALHLLEEAAEAREPILRVLLLLPLINRSSPGSGWSANAKTPSGNNSPRSSTTWAFFSPQVRTAAHTEPTPSSNLLTQASCAEIRGATAGSFIFVILVRPE
ncbi:unnamed protein product [Rangifer tarandus platyrhynchus]|uniref:Uncharacterized protein n=1 Tax=Rangifer tarandus platyrhynchus TaxID=3082113 RepID=A0AC59Y7W7_RANTA